MVASGWRARPVAISLADIIRAIDGPLLGVRGERPENLGYIGAAEPQQLQTVWIALRANERAILEDVTLEHLVSGILPDVRSSKGRMTATSSIRSAGPITGSAITTRR